MSFNDVKIFNIQINKSVKKNSCSYFFLQTCGYNLFKKMCLIYMKSFIEI